MQTPRHCFFLFIALLLPGGTTPAWGDVVCYERGITVDAKTKCLEVTLTPQPSNQAALDKLRQEHQAELEQRGRAVLEGFIEVSCVYCQSCRERVTAATRPSPNSSVTSRHLRTS